MEWCTITNFGNTWFRQLTGLVIELEHNRTSNVEEISDVRQGRRRTRTFSQTITSSEVVNEVILVEPYL